MINRRDGDDVVWRLSILDQSLIETKRDDDFKTIFLKKEFSSWIFERLDGNISIDEAKRRANTMFEIMINGE
jgi:hypothetical protein